LDLEWGGKLEEGGKGRIMKSFITYKYNYNDLVEEDEVGRACSTNGDKMIACRLLVWTY
jgi:hypothetical protein